MKASALKLAGQAAGKWPTDRWGQVVGTLMAQVVSALIDLQQLVDRFEYPGLLWPDVIANSRLESGEIEAAVEKLYRLVIALNTVDPAPPEVPAEPKQKQNHEPALDRQSRPVALGRAAKEWFRMDRRTLADTIESGSIAAKKLSERRWVFDIHEVSAHNPAADCKPK